MSDVEYIKQKNWVYILIKTNRTMVGTWVLIKFNNIIIFNKIWSVSLNNINNSKRMGSEFGKWPIIHNFNYKAL